MGLSVMQWCDLSHATWQFESLLPSCYGYLKPFTASFPHADIHQLLSPDLLHQIIKGTFKDHLITWVEEYLVLIHGKAGAAFIMANIDHQWANFTYQLCIGIYLSRFKHCCCTQLSKPTMFSTGTRLHAMDGWQLKSIDEGNCSIENTLALLLAIIQVYLPAITSHVATQMVRTISTFLDFCYLARHDVLDEMTLDAMDNALKQFHTDHVIFQVSGVRPSGFSLPCQHSMMHHWYLIQKYGAPNGICSSITESKHIKAVKEP